MISKLDVDGTAPPLYIYSAQIGPATQAPERAPGVVVRRRGISRRTNCCEHSPAASCRPGSLGGADRCRSSPPPASDRRRQSSAKPRPEVLAVSFCTVHEVTRLSALLSLLVDSLAEPDARPASVLIDELNAGRFESTPDDIDGRAARLARTSFKLMHGYDRDSSALCKIGLIPPQESACRSTLPGCDHA
jgi:hypothetical protein